MGRKDRELSIFGLTPATDLTALTEVFAQHGPCKPVFFIHGSTSAGIVCYEREEDVANAQRQTDGMHFGGRRLTVKLPSGKGKKGGGGGSGTGDWRTASATQSYDPSMPPPLAPGPRALPPNMFAPPVDRSASATLGQSAGGSPAPSSTSFPTAQAVHDDLWGPQAASASYRDATPATDQQTVMGPGSVPATPLSGTGAIGAAPGSAAAPLYIDELATDTWELSLYDSDYDDGFKPVAREKKVDEVTKDEWQEAYDLTRGFAKLGGAIMAVDVESWDQDPNHDTIIEVGLAHVEWKAGSGKAPKVKSEHLIVEENVEKRNGLHSPDAKHKFAFGSSKTMSESDICIKLQFLITKYSRNQPLILLFHSASAEISYFEIMGIDLHGYPTRIPQRLLDGCSASNRKESIILDTQRLWKSFIKGTDEDVKDPVTALNKVCRKLGLPTKHLHNAGNDALYTLQVFMKMAEKEMLKRKAATDDYATSTRSRAI